MEVEWIKVQIAISINDVVAYF